MPIQIGRSASGSLSTSDIQTILNKLGVGDGVKIPSGSAAEAQVKDLLTQLGSKIESTPKDAQSQLKSLLAKLGLKKI